MLSTSRRSRRVKEAIYASPARALRLELERRLGGRRETQADRKRQYRARQARQIHEAFERDLVRTEAEALSA